MLGNYESPLLLTSALISLIKSNQLSIVLLGNMDLVNLMGFYTLVPPRRAGSTYK